MTTFLTLVDREETRKYIRPEVDFETILASFTDANNKGPACEEGTWASSAQGVITILKSWTGIVYLSAFRRTSIQSLVDSLRLPYEDTRKQLLDLLFEIFRFKAPIWSADFHAALRRSDYNLLDDAIEYSFGSSLALSFLGSLISCFALSPPL